MPNATRCAYALLNDTTNSPVNLPSSNITKVALQYLGLAGGVDMDITGRAIDDLTTIATAAARAGARVILRGTRGRDVTDLIRIATAGKGCVTFSG